MTGDATLAIDSFVNVFRPMALSCTETRFLVLPLI